MRHFLAALLASLHVAPAARPVDDNQFVLAIAQADWAKGDFAQQTPAQQIFTAVYTTEGEVSHGGFAHFFRYTPTEIVLRAPESFTAIGAARCADIVKRANALVAGYPFDSDEMDRRLDELQAVLDGLDQDFYAYPDDLTALLAEHVRRNPQDFGSRGT